MPEKMIYNNPRIMPHSRSTFAGWIRRADPRHPDVEASVYDRGGSTTS